MSFHALVEIDARAIIESEEELQVALEEKQNSVIDLEDAKEEADDDIRDNNPNPDCL